jgi:hypothetical protein
VKCCTAARGLGIKPPLDQVVDERLHDGGVLGCSFDQGERMFVAVSFQYRSPVDLGIGDAMYRQPVISIYAPPKAHHSPMVGARRAGSKLYLLDRLAW